jgi:hypothetical protein
MKQEEIPTAEEFLPETKIWDLTTKEKELVYQSMIEFAKLHVQAALKEALDSMPCLGSSSDIPTYEEVEEAVLSAYPLDNIK